MSPIQFKNQKKNKVNLTENEVKDQKIMKQMSKKHQRVYAKPAQFYEMANKTGTFSPRWGTQEKKSNRDEQGKVADSLSQTS